MVCLVRSFAGGNVPQAAGSLPGAGAVGDTLCVAKEPGSRRIVLATNNPGKVREFRRLLEPAGWAVLTPRELGVEFTVEEDGTSYAENAAKKAQACADATGMLALADDSGIEVDALGGGPGIYSARFGGPGLDDAGRTRLLLERLAGVPEGQRTARYRAVVALAWPRSAGRPPVTFEGVEEGRIGLEPRGERGFGYDPVFLVEDGRTQAELTDEEKDAISHRGKAVRAAIAWLEAEGEG
ncbi:RdgB/HAM1 family non-canonical purine NTP pyrophosphatase [Tepidiforma bonchosmolovskayae]|uniref:dITP/XTP pyrophosphatase n=1 Tax=Tepidiforma bonchosmolovskayae TaxID=2601677 RepID=A0ABX6C019_9CHLR|nr:RdgB/HAM1 family non-canonical purine NTP pyrophosphatase [Tepidiforma bonchosmolovskayae]